VEVRANAWPLNSICSQTHDWERLRSPRKGETMLHRFSSTADRGHACSRGFADQGLADPAALHGRRVGEICDRSFARSVCRRIAGKCLKTANLAAISKAGKLAAADCAIISTSSWSFGSTGIRETPLSEDARDRRGVIGDKIC
jgi:hypothetical protein